MENKVRVLHVSSPLTWRGGEQQIAYLLKGLKEAHPEIESLVVCPEGSVMEAYLTKHDNQHHSYTKRSGLSPSYIFGVLKSIKSYKPNIIHIHDAHAHTAVVIAHLIIGSKIPIILHRRVDFHLKSAFFSRYKYEYKHIQKVICISNAIKTIVSESNIDKDKLELIYSGVDPNRLINTGADIRKELGLDKDKVLIGNIAAIADHKDYFAFIKVIKELRIKNPKIAGLIIGDGPQRNEIENFVKKENLEEHIHFLGYRADANSLIFDLDLFLMPSKTEGLGTSIIDAFNAGIPVVATNSGGISELVKHNKTGLLAEPFDYIKLAEHIESILSSNELRQELVKKAKAKAQSFHYINMVKKTYDLYESIMKNKQVEL